MELEAVANLRERLTLRASLGDLDAEFQKFLDPNPLTGTLEDIGDTARLRRAPEVDLQRRRRLPLAAVRALRASVHHSYQDEFFSSPIRRQQDPLRRDVAPANHRTDLSLSWETPLGSADGQLVVSAFANDVFGDPVRRVSAVNAGLFVSVAGSPNGFGASS